MQPAAISALVEELSVDIANASRRLELLRHEFDEQTLLVGKMWTARQALVDLLPDPKSLGEQAPLILLPATVEPQSMVPEPDAEVDADWSDESDDEPGDDERAKMSSSTGRKRIRSTPMVTQIVNEADRPLSRDEIRAEFDRRGWTPASWAYPDNAIGNALGRAADQQLVQRLDDGRFAPVSYEPPTSSDVGVPLDPWAETS